MQLSLVSEQHRTLLLDLEILIDNEHSTWLSVAFSFSPVRTLLQDKRALRGPRRPWPQRLAIARGDSV